MLRINQSSYHSSIQQEIAMTALDDSSLGIDLRLEPSNKA
jgi:hypothetical protein